MQDQVAHGVAAARAAIAGAPFTILLALPLAILQVYDRIIPHTAYATLTLLLIGIDRPAKLNSFTPEMFRAWMRILKAVPASVLWLLAGKNERKAYAVLDGFNARQLDEEFPALAAQLGFTNAEMTALLQDSAAMRASGCSVSSNPARSARRGGGRSCADPNRADGAGDRRAS